MNIYSLYDKIAKRFVSTTLAESDDTFVRQSMFAILMDYPLKDVEFYCVGQFDNDLGIIKPCKPRLCSWECYKFPTTRADKFNYLTLEEIEESAKNKKHEFLQKNKDKIEDLERTISLAKVELEKAEKEKDKKRKRELISLIKEVRSEIDKLKEIA